MPSPALRPLLAAVLAFTATLCVAATDPHTPHKKPARVTFDKSGSGETAAERDRRLLRECKGRPDAGACQGYTR